MSATAPSVRDKNHSQTHIKRQNKDTTAGTVFKKGTCNVIQTLLIKSKKNWTCREKIKLTNIKKAFFIVQSFSSHLPQPDRVVQHTITYIYMYKSWIVLVLNYYPLPWAAGTELICSWRIDRKLCKLKNCNKVKDHVFQNTEIKRAVNESFCMQQSCRWMSGTIKSRNVAESYILFLKW